MSADRPHVAALAVVTGMALLGLIDTLVPRIATEIGLWQFHAMRSALALPCLALAARLAGWRLLPLRPRRVAARSFLAGTAMAFYFAALAFLPVAVVAAGLFTAPVFVLLLSRGLLGQPIGRQRLVAVALGFAGILCILRPGTTALGLVAVLPILAGAFWGAAALATRELCAGEGAASLLAGFFAVLGLWGMAGLGALTLWPQEAAPGAAGFLLRGWVTPGPETLLLLLAQAAGSLVGVGLLIVAYGWGEAAQITVFEYSLLVFAAFWAWLLRGQTVDALAVAGMALIAASGVATSVRLRR